MEFVAQTLDEIVRSLKPLTVDWKDETAHRVIERLRQFRVKQAYSAEDVKAILDAGFEDGILICRLFLGFSDDQLATTLRGVLPKGIGITRYRSDPTGFLDALEKIGLLDAMAAEANRAPHWSDVLAERLRSGRGSAISGQRRGRVVEEFAEAIVRKVFGERYQVRCNFGGPRGRVAKCDFAIPSKDAPRILIEAKGYGATGSKMTDIIGDIEKIIAVKRPDTAFMFFTDGLTWRERKSDLRKIIEYQNIGQITRIYTQAMAERFEEDLRKLKTEYGL